MPFETRRTFPTVRPRPTPGNTNALLHCPKRRMAPAHSSGANGLPVATIARPSVKRSAASGVHSLFEVGLDSGNTTGRSLARAIARSTGSSKMPGVAEVPISTPGLAFSTVSSRLTRARSRTAQPASSLRPRA